MEQLKEILEGISEPKFYSIKDVVSLTGWSEKTVQELFNAKGFPSTNLGKEKKVERNALKEYFKIPRRR